MPPYMSVVIAARNDNYGGDFLRRIQMFANSLVLWDKYGLDAELVIVEWNPPEDRPRLKDAINWPEGMKSRTARIIHVPKEIHQKFPNSNKMPMYEYFAKNAGIRRASGQYVLITNPDLLFTTELITYLASRKLSEDFFYRVDRYDFHGPVPLEMQPESAIEFAKKRVYQVHIRDDGEKNLIPIGMSRKWYYIMTGSWPGSYLPHMRIDDGYVALMDDNKGRYNGVHTNASGDFILTSATNWHKIRGFPEFADTFTHLDSYSCLQLRAVGAKQVLILPPCMILHMEHHRTEQQSRPRASSNKWMQDLEMIQTSKVSPVFNDENWGLGKENLAETIIEP